MFADDLKMFCKIESVADCVTIQKELDSLFLWFHSVELYFNIDQYKSKSFSQSRYLIKLTYSIIRSSINMISSKKD